MENAPTSEYNTIKMKYITKGFSRTTNIMDGESLQITMDNGLRVRNQVMVITLELFKVKLSNMMECGEGIGFTALVPEMSS